MVSFECCSLKRPWWPMCSAASAALGPWRRVNTPSACRPKRICRCSAQQQDGLGVQQDGKIAAINTAMGTPVSTASTLVSVSVSNEATTDMPLPIEHASSSQLAVVTVAADAGTTEAVTDAEQTVVGPSEQLPAAEEDSSDSGSSSSSSSATADSSVQQLPLDLLAVAAAGSLGSIDDEVSAAEIQAAKEAEAARLRAQEAAPVKEAPWLPPTEYTALVGLAVALGLAGISNALLCRPMTMSYSKDKITRQCCSCCASPAAQAQHHQYLVRQPQRVLPPLPIPLRQQLDIDQLPQPTYRVPSLVTLPTRADDGLTASMVAAQEWVHSRVAYQLQQLAVANISTKVFVMWLFAMPFILLFGYMYHRAARVRMGDAMYKVYALLYRVPGIGIAKEENVSAYMVANAAFLAGMFSFAAILGIVSDEIKIGIKNARTGNYNMRLSGHILLLNWNSSSTALLRQIASAYSEGGMFGNGAPWPWNNRPPVVVLADKRKAQMDEAVHEMLRDRGLQLEVHTREGNPFKMSDLRKVAASKASTIIVLHPESASSAANAEAIKASVAMCLTALGPQAEQRVVVQMTGISPDEKGLDWLNSLGVTTRLVGRSAIQSLELPDRQLMLRLVAQTAAQPGILTCWLDILALANNSAQFYCAELPPALYDKPYQQVRRAFLHAVLCGYRAPDGVVSFNPEESVVPPPGSSLIFLGRGGSPHLVANTDSTVYDSAATSAAERLQRERTYKSKARNIVVANWPAGSIPELMEGFAIFTPNNSTITFTVQGEPPASWPTRHGSCKFNFVSTDHPTSVKTLLEAGIKAADAVVLGSGTTNGAEMEADARVLAAVLQVQDAVLASKRRDAPHLVAPIRRYATSKLASQYLEVLASEQQAVLASKQAAAAAGEGASAAGSGGLLAALFGGGQPSQGNGSAAQPTQQQQLSCICEPEFLVPNDVASALMTQVVSDPAYSDIMKALLFSSDGMELYLRNPASFNIPTGVPLSFAEVEEAVRLTHQTAVGYIRGQGSGSQGSTHALKNLKGGSKHPARQRKVVLGPSASHTVVFGESDRIVVLAQDFNV